MFSGSEQLICIPAHNSACQSAPAPLQYTAQNHWLRQAKLLGQVVAAHMLLAVKEVSYECASGTWVGCRPEWQQEEWHIESCK